MPKRKSVADTVSIIHAARQRKLIIVSELERNERPDSHKGPLGRL